MQEGSALRMEEKGNLYIYTAQASPAALEFQLTEPFVTAGIGLKLNDIPIEPNENNPETGRRVFHLPLRAGFNYIRLQTEPAQEIEVKKISLGESKL